MSNELPIDEIIDLLKYDMHTIQDNDEGTQMHGHELCDEDCGCSCIYADDRPDYEPKDGTQGFPPGK